MATPVIHVESMVLRRDGVIEMRLRPADVRIVADALTDEKVTLDLHDTVLSAEKAVLAGCSQ